MILVFDTETTGKAFFNQPASYEFQPRIVQLGAQLLDEDFVVRGEINLIVKPEGYTIPEDMAAIHGITQAIAEKCGVSAWCALSAFQELSKVATKFVAHNISFDALVLASAFIRSTQSVGMGATIRDSGFCTMQAMTPICKLPGNYGDYKWPKLQEAHQHAFGEPFEGAHDAMADVRACARLYKWLMERDTLHMSREPGDDSVPLDPAARRMA